MEVTIQNDFRNFMIEQMTSQGLSQGEVARRAGVTRPVVSKYLNGTTNPGPDVIEKFYRVLGFVPRLVAVPLKNRELHSVN